MRKIDRFVLNIHPKPTPDDLEALRLLEDELGKNKITIFRASPIESQVLPQLFVRGIDYSGLERVKRFIRVTKSSKELAKVM